MGSPGARSVGIAKVRPSRFGNLIEEGIEFAQCPESAAVRADDGQLSALSDADLRKGRTGLRSREHRGPRRCGDQLQYRQSMVSFYPGEFPRFVDEGEKSLA